MYEAIRQISANFPDARVTLSMHDPSSCPARVNVEAIGSFKSWVYSVDEEKRGRWYVWTFPYHLLHAIIALITHRWFHRPLFLTRDPAKRRLLRAYFDADLVISCGGNNLSSKRFFAAFFFWNIFSILFAHYADKPLYMFPESVGPFASSLHFYLTKFTLARMRLVLVRDTLSLRLVKMMALPDTSYHFVPDLAFGPWCDLAPDDSLWPLHSFCRQNIERDIPLIGITPINWGEQNPHFGGQASYEQALIELIHYITTEMDGHVFLFSQVLGPSLAEDDSRIARRLLDRMTTSSSRVTYVNAIQSPVQLMAAYGCMDFVVGTRMHSNIFALCASVPVIAIGYMSKTRGIMRSLGLEEWTHDIETINGPELVALFRRGWEKRQTTAAYLQTCIPEARKVAERAGSLIAKDWQRLQ